MKLKSIIFIASVLLNFNATFAQTGTIRGTVKDSKNQNLEFASAHIKGLSQGGFTDSLGRFQIQNVKPGDYTIVVEHYNYEKKEKNIQVKEGDTLVVAFNLEFVQHLEAVNVNGFHKNDYYNDSSEIVGKLPLKDLENPQVYNSIKREVLEAQVVTNFNDALKNATGVSRLWESTGRGGDGAEFYSMRGFSVQPTIINGLPSVTNGVIDPANVESIEVIKGPSGTLFGSPVISYGGLINVTTKKPYDKLGGNLSYTFGSFGLNRLTLDVNTPLNAQTAIRLNGAFTEQNSFQDAGFKKSRYFAPSFQFKASERLTFLINTEFQQLEAANAPMLFFNRNSPISYDSIDPFERNYENSFTSNDLTIDNVTASIQAQAIYTISKNWTSQTAVSRSSAKTNGYYQYLWDLSDGDSFYRYISKRNGETQTTNLQQNFRGDFKIGNMRNRLVVGVDYYESNVSNSSTGWVGNGIVSISDGSDSGVLTQVGVDSLLISSAENRSIATNRVGGIYFSNVINILPSFSAMVSLRADYFEGNSDVWKETQSRGQMAFSPKFGLVYQPVKDQVSLFANYMNGFSNIAPVEVADADGSNVRLKSFDPEHANQYEFGVKTDLFSKKMALTASYYNVLVSNKLMSDPNNINNTIQNGKVQSQGVEFSLIANPIHGLNLIAGYSNNETLVLEDSPIGGYLGLRPEASGPAQMVNFWASYQLHKSKFKGIGVGFGGNAASEHLTLNRNNIGTFVLPAYQVLNASLFYNHKRFGVNLKVNNLLNQKFYTGWSTVTPHQLRSITFNLSCNL